MYAMPGKNVVTPGIHRTKRNLCTACTVIRVRLSSGYNLSETPHVAHHRRSICHRLDIRVGNCCKLCELRAHITPSECYESPFIAHLVAVVGCAEDCNAVAIMSYLIPIILHLQHQYFIATIQCFTGLHHVSRALQQTCCRSVKPH